MQRRAKGYQQQLALSCHARFPSAQPRAETTGLVLRDQGTCEMKRRRNGVVG